MAPGPTAVGPGAIAVPGARGVGATVVPAARAGRTRVAMAVPLPAGPRCTAPGATTAVLAACEVRAGRTRVATAVPAACGARASAAPGARETRARAENSKGPTLCVGPFTRAVAEGFEPSVSFPTLAFEASSFGRSDTLPRESLDHLGRPSKSDSAQHPAGTGTPGQRSRKKAVRRAAQSASRTPWITSGRWLSRRSRTTSQSEPAAPAFSSRAP